MFDRISLRVWWILLIFLIICLGAISHVSAAVTTESQDFYISENFFNALFVSSLGIVALAIVLQRFILAFLATSMFFVASYMVPVVSAFIEVGSDLLIINVLNPQIVLLCYGMSAISGFIGLLLLLHNVFNWFKVSDVNEIPFPKIEVDNENY